IPGDRVRLPKSPSRVTQEPVCPHKRRETWKQSKERARALARRGLGKRFVESHFKQALLRADLPDIRFHRIFCAAETPHLQVIGRSRALLSLTGFAWVKKKSSVCCTNAPTALAAIPPRASVSCWPGPLAVC